MSNLKYFLYVRKSSESEEKQVASIPSQIEELKKLAKDNNLDIVKIYKEEKSAKAPGRIVFGEMLEAIHNGKAQGIICWKLDRLARNPVDGGSINWMLQQGIIKHIQTFQKSYFPNDNVLMMSLEFGMANQFILDLSVNTKRGQRRKIEEGWLPHKPPFGYLNNKYNLPDKPPIYKDEINFELIKSLWGLIIEKGYSVEKVIRIAKEKGLNNPLSRGKFYELFKNPFYYGYFRWNSELYKGKHEPMITKQQFDIAQAVIAGKNKPKGESKIFKYRGFLRCGECGALITAEEKIKTQKNGNVHNYTYYHCTKKVNPECSQKPIREEKLEEQVIKILDNITIPKEFHEWAIKYLKAEHTKEQEDRDRILKAQRKALDECKSKLDTIFKMRLDEELDSEEYKVRKKNLLSEKAKLEELLQDTNYRIETWFENADKLFSFSETAKEKFEKGNLEVKKTILSCLGSNLLLKDGMLDIKLNPALEIVNKLAPEVREQHLRLEPHQLVANQEFFDDLYAKNETWGG